MIVAGVMSGTSADGVDVALVQLRGPRPRLELLQHCAFPFPKPVRAAILRAMNASAIAVAELARLNFLLAELYADCVQRTIAQADVVCELVGCHGQTIYHQGVASNYLGHKLACTWQIGDGSVLAQRLGLPVVSDFRPADMAAGGTGAPLVPFVDWLLFRHARRGRIVQNIGGIANLTAIPAAAQLADLQACDTGPGNMVIDAICERRLGTPFDQDGRVAASGTVLERVVSHCLKAEFFRRPWPRTAGREEFGAAYVDRFLQRCGHAPVEDIVATATALTARSIALAVSQLSATHKYDEMYVSGGGTRNRTLMRMLEQSLAPENLRLTTSDELGVPSQAKEAVAFAVLAYRTWRRLPANVPGATGAQRSVVLGKVSYV